jgi:folate-binding protein YgfZ
VSVQNDGALAWCDAPRDVVLVQGDDAAEFLHSQLAQDLKSLDIGSSAHSLLLEPSGHVVALLRVVRHVDTVFTLDTDSGLGDAVMTRLKKFILRSKVAMRRSDWVVRSYLGTGARDVGSGVVGCASRWWGGVDDVDIIGDAATLPVAGTKMSHVDYDVRRVDAGWPTVGCDIDVGDLPATTGILRVAVSFSKGCYPGQELVERMDSRGSSAPVQLVVAPASEVGDVGSYVIVDGTEVGVVTSRGLERALVRVKRGAEVSEFWVRPDRFAESLL